MRKLYLAFLGLGQVNGYEKAIYELDGRNSRATEFVQVAEIELLGEDYFDRIIIVATKKSQDLHFAKLCAQLVEIGVQQEKITTVLISEDMTAQGQWEWFEQILAFIDNFDELTVDMTHGYRSIPIVFSAAINFLQKARNIKLNAVYYGAFEKNRMQSPIVDMKDFYVINEWAEAVSRLVEDADARKMAILSESAPGFQAGSLNDPAFILTLVELTDAFRNVDINHISEIATHAIRLIRQKEETSSQVGKILLNLVINEFSSLSSNMVDANGYTKLYFSIQLEIVRILLEHKLFMQAFTVMRELIGSIGMIPDSRAINSHKGRSRRTRHAEVFIQMFCHDETEWKFNEHVQPVVNTLLPFYRQLVTNGIESILRSFTRELTDYRNGFDHAWTSKKESYRDIREKGDIYFNQLNRVVELLVEHNILNEKSGNCG